VVGNGFDSAEDVARLVRGMVADMHKYSAVAPIRFPDPCGAFPGDILLRPPPVVLDANVLRNDIRRACRTGQGTVLITAANAGLLRLFCAEHVYQEVIEHSGDWTAAGPVNREEFLRTFPVKFFCSTLGMSLCLLGVGVRLCDAGAPGRAVEGQRR
jgi:hypothetical protein